MTCLAGMGTSVDGLMCVPIITVISGPSIRSPAVWQNEMLPKWTLCANFANQGTECKEQSSAQESVGELLVFSWLPVHNALRGTHGNRAGLEKQKNAVQCGFQIVL